MADAITLTALIFCGLVAALVAIEGAATVIEMIALWLSDRARARREP